MGKKRKQLDTSAGLVVAYVRKSPSGFPPNCVTIEHRKEYIGQLTRQRQAELVDDARRDGESIDAFYTDMMISGQGAFLEDRPEFLQMWEDALGGKVRRIYARDSARIARDFIQAEQFFGDMQAIGVIVRMPDLMSNENLSEEELVGWDSSRRHQAVANETMARFTAAKVKRTLSTMVSSGAWAGRGRDMLGLKYNKTTKHYDLDPETAPVAVKLFDAYVKAGGVARKAAEALNQMIVRGDPEAIRTPQGALWTSTIVLRIIRNPLYQQRVTWGSVDVPRPDKIPAVIPTDLLLEAIGKATIRGNTDAALYSGKRIPFTYSGLGTCGYCGGRVRAVRCLRDTTLATYRCLSASLSRSRCQQGVGISETRLDRLMGEAISIAVERLREFAAEIRAAAGANTRLPAKTIDFAAEYKRLDDEHDRYRDLYAQGITPTVEALMRDLAKVETRRRRLDAHRAETVEIDPHELLIGLDQTQRILSQSAVLWSKPRDRDTMDEPKATLLRDLGCTFALEVGVLPRLHMSRGKSPEIPGAATLTVQFTKMGLTGPDSITVTETEETARLFSRGNRSRTRGLPKIT